MDLIYRTRLSPSSIRLIHFTSGPHVCGQLKCDLQTFELREAPPFVALSYAWDEPQSFSADSHSEVHEISLNDNPIQVTANLYYALISLFNSRDAADGVHYWIDSLCIRQSDVAERTSQVAIMHEIYKSATRVHVWLGPAKPEHRLSDVRDFLRFLLQKYHYDEHGSSMTPKFAKDFLHYDAGNALVKEGLPDLRNDIWKSVVDFWDRAWFERVWVLQEVALAREVSIWCGDVKFEPDELVEESRFFVNSGLGNGLLLLRIFSLEKQASAAKRRAKRSFAGRKIGCAAVGIEDLRLFASGQGFVEAEDFKTAADRLLGLGSGETTSLDYKMPLEATQRILAVQLFLSFRNEASDERDHVFARLVLQKQVAEAYGVEAVPLAVDYNMTTCQVFAEVTKWMIETNDWLGVLCLVNSKRSLKDLPPDWPSWVPQYGGESQQSLMMFHEKLEVRIAEQTNMMTSDLRPIVKHDSLHVHFKLIGRVADVGEDYETMIEEGIFERTAKLVCDCTEQVDVPSVAVWMAALSGRSIQECLEEDQLQRFRHWLAFFILRGMDEAFDAGTIANGGENLVKMPSLQKLALGDPTKTVPTWDVWVHEFHTFEQRRKILDQQPDFQTVEVARRRLFRLQQAVHGPRSTDLNTLGVGPHDVQAGDCVYLASGAALPLVVRPDPCDGVASEVRGRFVGEANINDLGEASSRLADADWKMFEIW